MAPRFGAYLPERVLPGIFPKGRKRQVRPKDGALTLRILPNRRRKIPLFRFRQRVFGENPKRKKVYVFIQQRNIAKQ